MRKQYYAKPLIKWVGGKTQLLDVILQKAPSSFNTYYEPFLGGGAVFFALSPDKAVINDLNVQLINLYRQIASDTENVRLMLELLETMHNEEFYYECRNRFNELISKGENTAETAGLFVYLNKTGFNGLYRINSKGLFNVPSAKKEKVSLYSMNNLKAASSALKKATILNCDFEEACNGCGEGDFVFFDSPYYNTFDTYQSGGFSLECHKRLYELYKRLSDKGAYCMLTNSNEEYIKDLYKDYKIDVVNVRRMINRNGNDRKGQEVVITNY